MTTATRALICASSLLTPAVALACSSPYPGCTLMGSLEYAEPIPTDGVVAFKMAFEEAGPDDVEVTVTDELGVELTGAVEVVHFQPGNPEPPGGGSWGLLAWRPGVPFAPSSTYALHLACESDYGNEGSVVDELAALTTADGPAPPVTAPVALATYWEPWLYGAGEDLCCELDQCEEDSCTGETVCEECWKELQAEGPVIRVTLGAGAGGPPAHQLAHIVTGADGEGAPQFVPPGQPAVLSTYLKASTSGPWCVSWRSKSLATGVESEPAEVCAGEGETLAPPQTAPTPSGCKAAVADPDPGADAGTTDAGTADAGATDAGTTDAGATDAGSTDTSGSDTTLDTGETPDPDTGAPGPGEDTVSGGDSGAAAPDAAASKDSADAAADGSGDSGAPATAGSGDGCTSAARGTPPAPLWLLLSFLIALYRRPRRA